MNKNPKQRLLETMRYVNPDFIPLNESKFYVKPQEIPRQILDWATSILGRGFERKITIEKANGKVEIGMPWHNADREIHQFFKLSDGAQAVGNSVSKTGWSETSMFDDPYGTVEIPSGYVLATAGTYPKRLELIVADDAMNLLGGGEAANDLSDEALVALLQAKTYKPAYRQKFNPEVYQELIAAGLMNSNRAITIDGKNLINSDEAKARLKQIKEKDKAENGWNAKYKI